MIWDISWGGMSYFRVNFLPADPAEARSIILRMHPARAARVEKGETTLEMRPSKWQPITGKKMSHRTEYKMLPVRFTAEQIYDIKCRAAEHNMTLTEYARSRLILINE
jgi:hypothetical protein